MVSRIEGRTAGTGKSLGGAEGLFTPQLCLSVLLLGGDLDLLPVQPSHIQAHGSHGSSKGGICQGPTVQTQ